MHGRSHILRVMLAAVAVVLGASLAACGDDAGSGPADTGAADADASGDAATADTAVDDAAGPGEGGADVGPLSDAEVGGDVGGGADADGEDAIAGPEVVEDAAGDPTEEVTTDDVAPPDTEAPHDAVDATSGEDAAPDDEADSGQDAADADPSPAPMIVINEVLADGTADDDANGDGTIDAVQDEFVELVNVSGDTLDLSGWTLVERDFEDAPPRHTFPEGFELAAGQALVVFGGGDPPASSDAVVYVTANADDPGIPFALNLDDGGDHVRLLDETGAEVAAFAWGDAGGAAATSDQSLTRSPDLEGDVLPHSEAAGAAGAVFSPGARVDGSPL